jgi:hypothetical protein
VIRVGRFCGIMSRPKSIAAFVVVACVLFAGAYCQRPLYSSNQNTYFLQGLAKAGYGFLSADWLASQTDHIPLFSLLVSIVHWAGAHWLFYFLLALLSAIYAASLFTIATKAAGEDRAFVTAAAVLAGLTLLHTSWIAKPIAKHLPFLWQLVPHYERIAAGSTEGVAGQYILGAFLQPSAFGVLLLASIALFICRRDVAAIVCSVIAACFHPTYVLHAALLTGAYMFALTMEGKRKKAAAIGALALALALPIVTYILLALPPESPETLSRAQTILAAERFPYHADQHVWILETRWLQIVLLGIGSLLAFRNKRLFSVLALGVIGTIALVVIQLVSGSKALALMFPWRTSAWLIPASSAIVLGALASAIAWATARIRPAFLKGMLRAGIVSLSLLFLVGTGFVGARRTINSAQEDRLHGTVIGYARESAAQGQTYLVPLKFQHFRLATGVPIFVDWKSHPYKDVEVIEWHERVVLAREFYAQNDADAAAKALARIEKRERISHIVAPASASHLLRLPGLKQAYNDGEYVVLRKEPTSKR